MSGIEIESAVIQELSYDEQSQSLVIQFVKGTKGRYLGVPRELVGKMLTAQSAGAFFVKHIRNAFEAVGRGLLFS